MCTALPSRCVRATRLGRKEPLDMSTALPSCCVKYLGLLFLFFEHQGDKHATINLLRTGRTRVAKVQFKWKLLSTTYSTLHYPSATRLGLGGRSLETCAPPCRLAASESLVFSFCCSDTKVTNI